MNIVVAALAGESGSGTAALGTRVATILNWHFASFGSYVRAEAARRRLNGTRKDLQDTGLDLMRDPDGFCRAVVAQSFWRPGQSLIVDGLRHESMRQALRALVSPIEVLEIYVTADVTTRELRLLERGEFHSEGVHAIDEHPVEQGITLLKENARITFDGALPETELIDQLLDFLVQICDIPVNHSWVTSDNLVHLPAVIRHSLGLKKGDRLEFGVYDKLLLGHKIVDADRIRSAFGRMREELAGVNPVEWVAKLRDRGTALNEQYDSSD